MRANDIPVNEKTDPNIPNIIGYAKENYLPIV